MQTRSGQVAEGIQGYYSDEQLQIIILAGGGLLQGKGLKELKSALENAILRTQMHAGIRRWETAPPARAGEFEKVARAAVRLLQLLDVADDGKPHVKPKLRGGAMSGLQGQGFAWARRWLKTAEREKRVALHRRSRERRMADGERHAEAEVARAARKTRCREREAKRERWRRLHGGWPDDGEFPRIVETSEGDKIVLYGEDLALRAAVEGVQRIRTWAAFEAKRLSKEPPQTRNGKSRDAPMRRVQTFLVGQLALLYPSLFENKRGRFGVSKLAELTKSGKPASSVGGPGIRFVQACLQPLGITMSAAAIEKAWDACRADSPMRHGKVGQQTKA
jgi:hypothetical protein